MEPPAMNNFSFNLDYSFILTFGLQMVWKYHIYFLFVDC